MRKYIFKSETKSNGSANLTLSNKILRGVAKRPVERKCERQ